MKTTILSSSTVEFFHVLVSLGSEPETSDPLNLKVGTLRVMKKTILSSSTVEFFHVLVSLGSEPETSWILAERATS